MSTSMGTVLQLLVLGLNGVARCVPSSFVEVVYRQRLYLFVLVASSGRYCMIAAYSACFYDWVISLDQEVALIYPAPWNGVKAAYLFCRYYPMAIAPFHIWGLVGNHEKRVCESYYHALSACAMPTLLSAQFILMLRTYAFSGRKIWILVALSVTYFGLAGVIVWVLSKEFTLAPLFFFTERNACFAISDEPDITVLAASVLQGKSVQAPIAYHMGVLVTFFDCLNMLVVLWYWIQGRDTFGPLGKSKKSSTTIKTAVNQLGLAIAHTWHVGSSPTETKLRLEYSHMVDEALEMIAVDRYPEEISGGGVHTIHLDGC
ncbi:hypothetical protein EDB83DRAFT_2552797 [Lactarius deliciosus]|nr:hypothetical protein EDB83DRAFT_2552797 [Lactarius deliciosus]